MPGVGVTGPSSTAALPPESFTARSSNVCAISFVSPVTVKLASFVPPGALVAIAVHVVG